jgi:poly-beta-1,6-N-acetyl-D-glucosamine N-deacetylase
MTTRPHSRSRLLLWVFLLLLPAALTQAGSAEKLTVLSYHEIAEPQDALVPQYAVTPTMFLRQMDWLRNRGYHFVSIDDVIADRAGKRALPDKAVLITFDDGYTSVYTHAWPVLKMFRIPAVIAVVGGWLEEKDTVDFDGKHVPRTKLLSWSQLKEMSQSGLVEVGSHSFDLHHGLTGNPQGNREPAATTRRWLEKDKRYEDETVYRERVQADLKRNSDLVRRHTGKAPRVIAWPYGRYNSSTRAIAEKLGMPVGLTLDDGANMADTPLASLRRILVSPQMGLWELKREIDIRNQNLSDNDRPQKAMHVDLDYIYDADPVQQEKNLGHLLDRIVAMGVNTVYLQAYADPDGNGSADAVYFPNRHLPVRADLFNRVAWQIRTRTPVNRLYAWMPMLAWELPAGTAGAQDKVVTLQGEKGEHLTMGYIRLSPFSATARQTVREIFADLARSAAFDGLLFHDDVTLSDFEDASPFGIATYKDWGLPENIADIRKSDDLLGRWTILKINALDDMAMELADVVRQEQPALKTARNMYARVVQSPRSEVWYSQALDNSLARYDFTAIMAMPHMEKVTDANAFFRELTNKVKEHPGALNKVVFEIQAVDWKDGNRLIPNQEMADSLRTLYQLGAQHVGYYPDMLFNDHPDPAVLKPVFDSKANTPALKTGGLH